MSRVLVIHSSQELSSVLCQHILACESDVEITQHTPEDGILEHRQFDFGLILLEYDLGSTNGITWFLRKKDDARLPPVVLIIPSGYDEDDIVLDSINAGLTDFIGEDSLRTDDAESIVRDILYLLPKYAECPALVQDAVMSSIIKQQKKQSDIVDIFELSASIAKSSHTVSEQQIRQFGFSIPHYTLISQIADGGSATVFLAKSNANNMRVAVKVLFLKSDEQATILKLRRFMKEYKLLCFLKNPNVVRIYESGFAADFAYIVMEYFSLGDLGRRIRTHLDEKTVLGYFRQLCHGLEALHKLNIIHHDIKPKNILFGHDGTLKIADLGSAQNIFNSEKSESDYHMFGTPYYMSPEQAAGKKTDKSTDLYSLGVLFYHMLTNSRPYIGNTLQEIKEAHLYQPIPRLPKKYSKYQPLIDGLLAKNSKERFQSVQEVFIALDWLENENISVTNL